MADFEWNREGLAQLDRAIVDGLDRMAIRVERAAKRAAPVDTGRLRSSIARETTRDADGFLARVGTDVEYAPYVEFGTQRASAQPFLRPALDSVRGIVITGDNP